MLAKIEGAQLVTEDVITEIERETLIDLRDRLQSGEIKSYQQGYPVTGLILELGCWHTPCCCGTVGCIAGLCWEISEGQAFSDVIASRGDSIAERPKLISLFLHLSLIPRNSAPAEAAHAITTFLATGEADWSARP